MTKPLIVVVSGASGISWLSTHQVAEPARAAPAWEGADADLGQGKRGVVSEDPQITGQGQLEAAAVRIAGNGGDGGLP